MLKIWRLSLFAALGCALACNKQEIKEELLYQIEGLEVYAIDEHLSRHVSYIPLSDGSLFPCNGLLWRVENEVWVFDTPVSDSISDKLLIWLEDSLNLKVRGVVCHHFHEDCLGGLTAFDARHIPSYAEEQTKYFAEERGMPQPQFTFKGSMILILQDQQAICAFPGPGHSPDNIVSYFPNSRALFGGCLVKSMDAPKGYLGDAVLEAWPETIETVEKEFRDIQCVIPGHGKIGGPELLSYTKELFRTTN